MLAEAQPQALVAPKASLQELHFEIEQLNSEYSCALDNERYEEFLELFAEDCLYRVVPRENHLLGLPIAAIHCESKGMIKDRVHAARESTMAEPRTLRHFISNVRVLEAGADEIRARSASFCATRHRSALYIAKRQGLGRNARSLARRSARFAR